MIHSLLLARKDDEFPSDYRFLDERFFPRELDELDEESLPLDDDELDEYDDELVELPLVLPLLDELDDDPDDELELLDRRLFRRFFFSPNAALNRRSSTPAPSGTSSNCSSANFCLFAGSRIRSVALARRTYVPSQPHSYVHTPVRRHLWHLALARASASLARLSLSRMNTIAPRRAARRRRATTSRRRFASLRVAQCDRRVGRMADLRRVRGANTQEQLEALERAFIESRDAPCASVRRVGDGARGNPETVATDDVERGDDASTAREDADDDEDAPRARSTMMDVMGDVVERETSASVGIDAATTAARRAASAATGFPEAKHRSETNFGRKSRYAARKAAMRDKGKSDGDDAGEGKAREAEKAPVRLPRVDPEKEDASIQEENDHILAAMSPAAVKEAQEELAGRLNPKTLEFLRNRGANKARVGASTASPSAPTAPAPKRARDRSDVAAEASARTKKVTTVGVEHVRFALDGSPLLDATVDVATGSAPAPLPTERDPLRAGEGSDIGYTFQEACALTRSSVASQRTIGLQIIGKILKLARRWSFESVDPLPYDADEDAMGESDVAPRLPNGVTWASVWVYATVDCAVITLLRRALDDTQTQATVAALSAIRSLCGGIGVGGVDGLEVRLVDMLESSAPCDPSDLSYTSPLWRSEPENAPCGGSGFEPIAWEHAVEEIRLAEDSTVELADEPDQVEEGLNKQMMERRQATEQAADPIAALLRMGILQRLRYLLEVERTPQAEVFTHELLEAFTRHSKAAANAVAKCPRLVSIVIARVKDSCGGGSRGSPTEPATVGIAHAVCVLRLISQTDADVTKELVKEGALKSAIQAAVTFGGVSIGVENEQRPRPRGYAAMLWRETLRLWAGISAWGLDTPAFDAIHPLIAPWMETNNDAEESLAMDIFALLTTLSKSLPLEGAAEDAGPPAELEIIDTDKTLSWRCATMAAKCAESWIASGDYDTFALYTVVNAGRFLAALVVRSPNDAQPMLSRVLGSPNDSFGAMSVDGILGAALSALDSLVYACSSTSVFSKRNIELSAWGSVLQTILLLTIVSPDVWNQSSVTTLASQIIRKFGGKRRGVSSSRTSFASARGSMDCPSRLSRGSIDQRVSDGGLPTGDFSSDDDPTVWMGEHPIVATSKLALQRALIIAMEILDKAFTSDAAPSIGRSPLGSPPRRMKRDLQEDAAATVDATLGLISMLPPGAGVAASQAISSGIYSTRVLEPLLSLTKNALGDAVSVIQDSNEEERGRLAIRETGVNLVAASVSLVPTAEIVREALLGGFAMELTTSSEAKSISTPGPCVAVGSLLPGHPLWYLAPCSPRTTIQGWGTAGIACTLSLLMGMELGKVPRVRAIRPALKMSAIGAIYTMGPNVWRDPAVSAPLGLLTDLYWRRMVKNYIQAYHQGVRGYSMDLGSFSAGEGGLNDPLQQAQGTGDAAAAAAMVNAFASESFGDALFARHVAMWLRVRVSPKARAAAWIALSDGVALHLLPSAKAMVPPAAAYVFFPPGGEPDPTMREIYIKSIESGALDKALSGWAGDDYPTPGRESPPITAALAIHALAHVILSPGAGAETAVSTLRRILHRPNTSVVLRALIHTPLTIKRRPSFACASVGAHKTPFGNGFVYGKRGQDIDIPPRRTLLLDVCGQDAPLIAQVEHALVQAGLLQPDAISELSKKLSSSAQIQEQSAFYK